MDDHDPEGAVGVNGDNLPVASKTYPVSAARAPVREVLMSEHEKALLEEVDRVKASYCSRFVWFLVCSQAVSCAQSEKHGIERPKSSFLRSGHSGVSRPKAARKINP